MDSDSDSDEPAVESTASVVPKSNHPGVSWHKQKGKWRGTVVDTTERLKCGAAKQRYTAYFSDEQECIDAQKALKAEVEEKKAKKLKSMAQELDHTRDLPPCPPNAEDAEPNTAYYGEALYKEKGAETKEFRPDRFVRVSSGKRGFGFFACCREGIGKDACFHAALNGRHFCHSHGGRLPVGEAAYYRCSCCNDTVLWAKRLPSNGGNGLCLGCEDRKKQEARENGHDGPLPVVRWEKHCFNHLLPLIKHADGTPFPPDQLDERKGGGLGTSKAVKRRRECDTDSNYFPDGLWPRRNKQARIILAVTPEIDENSHTDVKEPSCESAKIDGTFHAIQDIAAKEGASKGSVGRCDAKMVPVVTIRMNPNAYDGGNVPLKVRLDVTARLMNHYLQMPEEEVAKLKTDAPIVHMLYYHSKQGGKILNHYAEAASRAGWEYTVHGPEGPIF